LRRIKSLVFGTVRGVGIKCLAAEEIVSGEASNIKGIRRKATAGVERLKTFDAGELPTETRNTALSNLATLTLVSHTTSRPTQTRILDKVSNNEATAMDTNRLLEAAKGV
jgi:hypothetical protein